MKTGSKANQAAKGYKEKVVKSVTVSRPVQEVYEFWRHVENFPRFMKNLESVQQMGGNRTHWKARGPLGKTYEWEAEIVDQKENGYFSWRSLGDSEVDNGGTVKFDVAPAKEGTLLTVVMGYNPPAGKPGLQLAYFLGDAPEQQLEENLNRLKSILEKGTGGVVEFTAMLKRDHDEVKDLFQQFTVVSVLDEKTEEKQTVVEEMIRQIKIHTALEEQIFYPVVRNQLGMTKVAEHSLEEHREVEQIIEKLERTNPEEDEYDRLVGKLINAVTHHIDEEEKEMLPVVERSTTINFEELDRQMKDRRAKLQHVYS